MYFYTLNTYKRPKKHFLDEISAPTITVRSLYVIKLTVAVNTRHW